MSLRSHRTLGPAFSFVAARSVSSPSVPAAFAPLDWWSDPTTYVSLDSTLQVATALNGVTAGSCAHSFFNRSSGKYYVELRLTNIVVGPIGVGLAGGSFTFGSGYVGGTSDSIACYSNAGIYINNSPSYSVATTPTNGDYICIAVDTDNARAWFRVNVGTWNNSGTANPATNTGGIDISGLGSLVFVVCDFEAGCDGSIITSNFYAATQSSLGSGAAPVGFLDWANWTGVTSGLVHHYALDEPSVISTTIKDRQSGGLDGTASGSGVSSAQGPGGRAGGARQFSSDVITFAGVLLNNLNGSHSVSAWIYSPDVASFGPDGTPQCFINMSDLSSLKVCLQNAASANPDQLVLGNSASGAPGGNTAASLFISNTWTHVAWTFPNAGTSTDVIFYVNGVAVSMTTGTGTTSSTTNAFGGKSTGSGRVQSGSRLARVLVYSRVLTSAEVYKNFLAR